MKFYEEAEQILAQLPRIGVPMILREVRKGVTKPYSFSGMQKIVHTMRDKIGLPSDIHARCLPPRRHDRAGGGGID